MAEASTKAVDESRELPPPYEAVDKSKDASNYNNSYPLGPLQPGPSSDQQPYQYQYQQQATGPLPPTLTQPGDTNTATATTTLLVAGPTPIQYTTVIGFTDTPVQLTCSHCQTNIVTVTHYEAGNLTWLIFALLMFLCCWFFAWVPFIDRSTHDVIHTCPNCHAVLGRFKRM